MRPERAGAGPQEQLACEFTPERYRQIRRLWTRHWTAENRRGLPGRLGTLTEDCIYEVVPTGQRWEGKSGLVTKSPTRRSLAWEPETEAVRLPEDRLLGAAAVSAERSLQRLEIQPSIFTSWRISAAPTERDKETRGLKDKEKGVRNGVIMSVSP